jgi:hypothetical protein
VEDPTCARIAGILAFGTVPKRAVKLPNIEDARINRTKIVDYLLAVDHPEGAGKATSFPRFGFSIADWQTFAGAPISHARVCRASKVSESRFGTKYQIDGPLACPDGRSPAIRAVWIVDAGTDFPRLITAHPLE